MKTAMILLCILSCVYSELQDCRNQTEFQVQLHFNRINKTEITSFMKHLNRMFQNYFLIEGFNKYFQLHFIN